MKKSGIRSKKECESILRNAVRQTAARFRRKEAKTMRRRELKAARGQEEKKRPEPEVIIRTTEPVLQRTVVKR